MSVNKGVAPLDATTDVGRMRLATGDTSFVPLVPSEVGFASYSVWSDAELQAFLDLAGGSIPRAIAIAYRQMGASWASSGATIKTDDLTYSSKDSVGNWLTLANYWDKVADDQDSAAVNDYFDLVPMGVSACCTAEGAPGRLDLCCGRGW